MSKTGIIPADGARFGRGVVLGTGIRCGKNLRPGAILRCDCGQHYSAELFNLRGGRVNSCGCLQREVRHSERDPRISPPADGTRFGRGVVLGSGIRCGKQMQLGAIMLCDCGQHYSVMLGDLRTGRVKSCGCLHRDHEMSHHPLYGTWVKMLDRCENPKCPAYPNYGGRGIRVCDRWHDVTVFIADLERWLGPRPAGMTLDRIQNDHDYRLDNVRWLSRADQNRHRRPFKRSS